MGEQAAFFRHADVVVGAHGAAFAHLPSCRPGTRFLEIFREGHFASCFQDIATAREIPYGFLVAEAVGVHLRVDLDLVSALLDEMEVTAPPA